MAIYIKIFIILSVFIVLSIKKFPLFLTLFTLSLFIGFFFLDFRELYMGLYRGLFSLEPFLMVILIWITMSFSSLINTSGNIDKTRQLLLKSVKNPVILFPFFPALIGLFPMPGGALVSAPMLEGMSKDSGISNEAQGVINFWFRHIWEPVWPLYPGVILFLHFLNISVIELIKHQFFLTFFMIISGFIFIVLPERKNMILKNNVPQKAGLMKIFYYLWPIIALLLGTAFIPTGMPYLFLLIILIGILFAIERKMGLKTVLASLKKGFSLKLILLIPVIYVFKEYIQLTGFRAFISNISNGNISIPLLVFLIPLIFGLMFGITIGFVSFSYPIIGHLLHNGGAIDHYLVTLFFLGGYLGIYFSPLHLCLLVTGEYFKTTLLKMYGKMIIPGIVAAVLSLIFNRLLNG